MRTWFHAHPTAALLICWIFGFCSIVSGIRHSDNLLALLWFGFCAVSWTAWSIVWWDRT